MSSAPNINLDHDTAEEGQESISLLSLSPAYGKDDYNDSSDGSPRQSYDLSRCHCVHPRFLSLVLLIMVMITLPSLLILRPDLLNWLNPSRISSLFHQSNTTPDLQSDQFEWLSSKLTSTFRSTVPTFQPASHWASDTSNEWPSNFTPARFGYFLSALRATPTPPLTLSQIRSKFLSAQWAHRRPSHQNSPDYFSNCYHDSCLSESWYDMQPDPLALKYGYRHSESHADTTMSTLTKTETNKNFQWSPLIESIVSSPFHPLHVQMSDNAVFSKLIATCQAFAQVLQHISTDTPVAGSPFLSSLPSHCEPHRFSELEVVASSFPSASTSPSMALPLAGTFNQFGSSIPLRYSFTWVSLVNPRNFSESSDVIAIPASSIGTFFHPFQATYDPNFNRLPSNHGWDLSRAYEILKDLNRNRSPLSPRKYKVDNQLRSQSSARESLLTHQSKGFVRRRSIKVGGYSPVFSLSPDATMVRAFNVCVNLAMFNGNPERWVSRDLSVQLIVPTDLQPGWETVVSDAGSLTTNRWLISANMADDWSFVKDVKLRGKVAMEIPFPPEMRPLWSQPGQPVTPSPSGSAGAVGVPIVWISGRTHLAHHSGLINNAGDEFQWHTQQAHAPAFLHSLRYGEPDHVIIGGGEIHPIGSPLVNPAAENPNPYGPHRGNGDGFTHLYRFAVNGDWSAVHTKAAVNLAGQANYIVDQAKQRQERLKQQLLEDQRLSKTSSSLAMSIKALILESVSNNAQPSPFTRPRPVIRHLFNDLAYSSDFSTWDLSDPVYRAQRAFDDGSRSQHLNADYDRYLRLLAGRRYVESAEPLSVMCFDELTYTKAVTLGQQPPFWAAYRSELFRLYEIPTLQPASDLYDLLPKHMHPYIHDVGAIPLLRNQNQEYYNITGEVLIRSKKYGRVYLKEYLQQQAKKLNKLDVPLTQFMPPPPRDRNIKANVSTEESQWRANWEDDDGLPELYGYVYLHDTVFTDRSSPADAKFKEVEIRTSTFPDIPVSPSIIYANPSGVSEMWHPPEPEYPKIEDVQSGDGPPTAIPLTKNFLRFPQLLSLYPDVPRVPLNIQRIIPLRITIFDRHDTTRRRWINSGDFVNLLASPVSGASAVHTIRYFHSMEELSLQEQTLLMATTDLLICPHGNSMQAINMLPRFGIVIEIHSSPHRLLGIFRHYGTGYMKIQHYTFVANRIELDLESEKMRNDIDANWQHFTVSANQLMHYINQTVGIDLLGV